MKQGVGKGKSVGRQGQKGKQVRQAFDKELEVFEAEIGKSTDSVYGVLIAHLYVEHLLERYIKTKIKRDSGLFGKEGLSFSDKLKLTQAYGELQSQLVDALSKLNSLRNDCAHRFGYKIEEDKVKNFGRTLGKDYKRIISAYPNAEVGGIAPIVWNICGQVLRVTLEAEGFK